MIGKSQNRKIAEKIYWAGTLYALLARDETAFLLLKNIGHILAKQCEGNKEIKEKIRFFREENAQEKKIKQ